MLEFTWLQPRAVDENSLASELWSCWWRRLSCVKPCKINGGSCSQAPTSGISSGVVTVVNVLSFGLVGDRPDALALHEVTTCTVSVPMLLNACFVMQDWCRIGGVRCDSCSERSQMFISIANVCCIHQSDFFHARTLRY